MPEENSKRLAETANRLYWGTSRPAGQLAHELGISRSKFYALIEPLALERKCDVCSGTLIFGSRTDREAGRGRCPDCGARVDVPIRVAEQAAATRAPAAPGGPGGPGPDSMARRHAIAPESRDLWISAAVGVAVGALVTAWLRRR